MDQRDEDHLIYKCDYCKEIVSPLYEFTCHHKICSICLFRLIFTKHIHQFKTSERQEILCTCKNEDRRLYLELSEIFNLLKAKATSETKRPQRKKCETHNKDKEYFCLDCNILICEECASSQGDEHYSHKMENNELLANKTKHFFSTIDIKNQTFESFAEHLNSLGKKFQEVIEVSYDTTLKLIDSTMQLLTSFRSDYITHYKNKLEKGVFTLKILKLFYLNYYFDRDRAINSQKFQNLYLLKYLNDINYEIEDVNINHNANVNQQLLSIKKILEDLRKVTDNVVSISFSFKEIPKKFKAIQTIDKAHDKMITGVIALPDNRFLTSSHDFNIIMWEMDPKKFDYKPIKKVSAMGKIGVMQSLRNNKFLTCTNKETTITLWKYLPETKDIQREASLTGHENLIMGFVQLSQGNKIASCDNDHTIIIWEENEHQNYMRKQDLIGHQYGIYSLCCLFDGRILSGGGDNRILIWKESNNSYSKDQTLKGHEGRVRAIMQLKDSRVLSAGDEKSILVWEEEADAKFKLVKKIKNAHENSINAFLLIDDGRFISVSKDKTAIVWSVDEAFENEKGKIREVEKLTKHSNTIYAVCQVTDGMVITTDKDGRIVVWKNRGS